MFNEKSQVFPFEIKTVEEKEDRWEFKGYASVFNIPDRVKDIVEPGAFKRTIDHHNGKFPLCWMHNKEEIIGGVKVEEDHKGLFVNPGFVLKDIQRGLEAYKLMKADVIDGMSFAYKTIKSSPKGKFRSLKELAMGEVTLGPSTMIAHPQALVTEVKTMDILIEYKGWMEEQMSEKIWEDEEGWTEIRYRVKNPGDFVRIRPWWIKDDSIRALGGPLKSDPQGGIKIQALRFVKRAGWTLAKAKDWVQEHPDFKLYEAIAEVKFSFDDGFVDMKAAIRSSLPLADRGYSWDVNAAEKRVRAWATSGDKVNFVKYRRAFLWYNAENPELLGSYKLQIGDIINGSLKAVPNAIIAAAAVLRGARGGVDIPSSDVSGVKAAVGSYYSKIGLTPPWAR